VSADIKKDKGIPMANFHVWVLATRPKTLPAAVGPVLVGSSLAFADGGFDLLPAMAALLIAILLQIGVNLANDYFDFVKGIDTHDRLGPVRITQSGLVSPKVVKSAMMLTFMLALFIGLYMIMKGGWPVVVIGTASILAALGYSGGPYPLASHGLGDIFVFIFFGLVAVCGTYYVQTLGLTWKVVLMAAAVGLPITAIIVINNVRDIRTDQRAGKNTLAVILGERGSKFEYTLLWGVAYAILPVSLMAGWASLWLLLPFFCLPWVILLTRVVWKSDISSDLNLVLAKTARLSLVYNLLLSISLLLA
jgi:1,4-dihydroxy-2-naphthoate polyprenyltransferase